MFEYMTTLASYYKKVVPSVLREYIANTKFYLHRLYFEEYLIQQKTETIVNISVRIYAFILQFLIYSCCECKNIQHSI